MRESQNSIPEALKNFDQLPDTANVRQPIVQALYACSSASIWRGVKAGRIPKPRKLSPRTTCWNVGELRAALAVTGNQGA
ncbi:helix-turn-helix transcriptional regulator [Nitrosomonas communis]|uniref:Transcriptional regulator, AlpA family n=1 Tax=Nitrosomonas communis TaxID=44574 RepID=A0A1I4WQE1_9PROT|nr:AlpA family phage regulatory protein [Nitrosomonas communis]SFN15657.1 transcriptional regulator, AlpA family [Nitrosomonas communis]